MEDFDLSTLKGKKLLIVNVASKRGLTPQHKQLEELYKEYKNLNFEVLAFPSSDFANQEYSDIVKRYHLSVKKNYGVTFPILKSIGKGKSNIPFVWLMEKNKMVKRMFRFVEFSKNSLSMKMVSG